MFVFTDDPKMSDEICRPPPRLILHREDLNSENCNPGVSDINDIFIVTLYKLFLLPTVQLTNFPTFREKLKLNNPVHEFVEIFYRLTTMKMSCRMHIWRLWVIFLT